MTTPTLVSALEQAAEHREGVDLLAYSCSGRINLKASDPTVLTDVDLLKVGTFNGWTFTASDLEACVEHFVQLTAGGIFTPPVRLDHSWSILQVIGYIDAMRTAIDVDGTTGTETTFLRGDLRITEPQALELIKRGTAVNRSSELGPYETNSGVIYPLICYGVAFVDIPAVEGLRPIELSRRYGAPRTVTTLTDERTTAVTPEEKAAADAAAAASTAAPATPPAAAAPAAAAPADATATPATPAVAAPTTTAPAEGETAEQAELRQLRETNAALLAGQRDADVQRFQSTGVLVAANLAHGTALLGHDDPAVRTAARELLSSIKAPVALGQTVGALAAAATATATPAGDTGSSSIDLAAMPDDPDAVGEWWASLETAQRKAGTPEHAAMTKWRLDRAK